MSRNFTLSEAADFTRCSDATMRRYIKSGRLPAVLVARRFLVSEDDLAKFMRQGKRITSKKAAATTAPAAE